MFPFDVSGEPARRGLLGEALFSYRMRWKRRRLLLRALRNRKQISRFSVKDVPRSGILAFATMRNEMLRLEYWLDHYRRLGVAHFLIVDNASNDGTAEFLAAQRDVSVWTTPHSYKASRFGVDWLTCLQVKFGHGRWCLTVDADELLVYPESETRPLPELTEHLSARGQHAFGALMLDLYPKGPISEARYQPGADPTETLSWFDASNYRARIHPVFGNLWIQGGVRDRVFFNALPERAPTLNKTPLVFWSRRYAYVTSTHQILPRRLNDVFETSQSARVSGVLLHTKFLPNVAEKSAEEMQRGEHFENSALYRPYYEALTDGPDLWDTRSTRYEGPAQLEALGLMTRGNWA